MLLEQEEKYLWIAFSILGIVIFLVIGLCYYFWKRRKVKESRNHSNEIQNNIQNFRNITDIESYSPQSKQKEKQISSTDITITISNSNDNTTTEQKEYENVLQESVEINKSDTNHLKNQGLDAEISLPSIESNISIDSIHRYAKLPGKKSILASNVG